MASENALGKEVIACNKQFRQQCFSTLSQWENVILATFNLLSANAFSLVMSENLSFGKGLRRIYNLLFGKMLWIYNLEMTYLP